MKDTTRQPVACRLRCSTTVWHPGNPRRPVTAPCGTFDLLAQSVANSQDQGQGVHGAMVVIHFTHGATLAQLLEEWGRDDGLWE
jgi:hypothetical protein